MDIETSVCLVPLAANAARSAARTIRITRAKKASEASGIKGYRLYIMISPHPLGGKCALPTSIIDLRNLCYFFPGEIVYPDK